MGAAWAATTCEPPAALGRAPLRTSLLASAAFQNAYAAHRMSSPVLRVDIMWCSPTAPPGPPFAMLTIIFSPSWCQYTHTTRRLNWLKLFSGAVGMGSWGLPWWYLRVPPIPLGGWGTGNTPHLPPKCPWQNFPQQPRKPGHQTAGGGRGPGVRAVPPPAPRAVHWHPGRSPSGWFGRGVACGPLAPVAATSSL